MKDKQFDHIINHKLSSLKANPNQADWEQLQAKIELDLQSDVQFDSSISDKVSQLTMGAVASTPDWESFSQKLNQTVEFDATIKQKLNQIPATKVSEHWLILHERLQGIRDLKRSILRIKVGESLLMISLLFCFVNLSHYLLPSDNLDTTELAVNNDNAANSFDRLIKTSLLESQEAVNSIDQGGENSIVLQQETTSHSTVQSVSPINDDAGKRVTKTPIAAQPIRQASYPASSTFNEMNVVERVIPSKEVRGNIHSIDQTEKSQTNLAKASMIPLLTSEVKDIELNSQGLNFNSSRSALAMREKVAESYKGRFAIHTLIGVGVDQITTADDERFDLLGYQHYAMNSDVGLRVSYDVNNWSFETGVTILHKGYKPKYLQDTIRVQNEAVVLSLESIDLELVSIPVTVKRFLTLDDNLSIFGMVGLEYLHISSVTYDINERNTELPEVGKELEVVSALEYKVNSPVIKNQSMNYTVGLGLSKSINPLIDVYGQTMYRGQLSSQGIGINHDKFNSLTVQAGVKLRLSEKN